MWNLSEGVSINRPLVELLNRESNTYNTEHKTRRLKRAP